MLRLVLLCVAVGQVLAPILMFRSGFSADVQSAPRAVAPNPVSPSGYAFIIWAVIYIAALVSAWRWFRMPEPLTTLDHTIVTLSIAGYLACIAWLAVARFGPLWATIPLIWIMLGALGGAFVLAATATGQARDPWIVGALAVYVGWLTAAAFVNTADVAPGYGFERFGLAPQWFGVLVIIGAGAVAFGLTALIGANIVYLATVAWALVAIIVANAGAGVFQPVPIAATVATVGLIGLAALPIR